MSEPEAVAKKRKAADEEQKPVANKKLPANNETVTVVDDSASTNQPNHYAGSAYAAAVAAMNERKTFEYSILKYARPIMEMGLLTSTWNNLRDYNPFYEDEGGERQNYIRNMEQIICTGRCDYCNPYGEDDQDNFLGFFYELTQREQKVFLKTAKEKKFIAASDVTKMFEDPPTRPYFVNLKKVTDKYQDGSERFPFTSMEDAEHAITDKQLNYREDEDDVVVIDCAPDCKRAECSHPQCRKQVCTEHGLGRGIYHHDPGEIVFNFQKCINCKKVVCEGHKLSTCDVCSMAAGAERSVTGDYCGGPFPLCQDCGTICELETDDAERCGFFCCNSCIDNHRCGYYFDNY
jgi:hypothetical protein